MRWLARRPWWLLAVAWVVALVGVVLGQTISFELFGVPTVVMVFLLFFATLMALVARRETPRPPSPH
ncbi:MAG TPA: hypothetical protein VMU65_10010 [Candidatus Saccharimonadales bacterium]|nr:hypothetical protein [Candidatus Saccharimonadales bacterium]